MYNTLLSYNLGLSTINSEDASQIFKKLKQVSPENLHGQQTLTIGWAYACFCNQPVDIHQYIIYYFVYFLCMFLTWGWSCWFTAGSMSFYVTHWFTLSHT